MKSLLQTTLSIMLGALLLTAAAPPDPKETARLAEMAATPADHAKVAQRYLAQAKSLEDKARRLENSGPTAAMEQKWPALMSASREKKEQQAMQLRRAARESHERAQHHSKLAGKAVQRTAAE